jgi:hypothetical protein
MKIEHHFYWRKTMSKKVLKAAVAVELAKQLAKAKNVQVDRIRATQLPVKAHTSDNAKLAIIVSLVTSGIALTAVVYSAVRAAQKEADRRGEALFDASFPTTQDVKNKVAEVVADAKETVADVKEKVAEAPVVKKVTRTAKDKTDAVVSKPEVKEAAETVAEKTEKVAEAARKAKDAASS